MLAAENFIGWDCAGGVLRDGGSGGKKKGGDVKLASKSGAFSVFGPWTWRAVKLPMFVQTTYLNVETNL